MNLDKQLSITQSTLKLAFLHLVVVPMEEEVTQLTIPLGELHSLLLTITPLIPIIENIPIVLVLTVVTQLMEQRFEMLLY